MSGADIFKKVPWKESCAGSHDEDRRRRVWICDVAELTVPIASNSKFKTPEHNSYVISEYYILLAVSLAPILLLISFSGTLSSIFSKRTNSI